MMKTIYTKTRNNMKTIELKLPQWLKDQNVNRIASEYGTLYIGYKDRSLRTTFDPNDIDSTLWSFHNKSISIRMSRDLADAIRKFMSDNWFILIGKGE